ncbi:MAG TPA: 50S ribosomal protein L25 [Planctomycetaceae bacterium]|nr:50S ribosomal protein L25 [Planctomycetaceae bacterium]
MSKEVKLVAEPRSEQGSAACRRLRWEGLVPGNVYGHAAETTSVKVAREVITAIVKSGSKVVDLDISGKQDKALIREVQWDAFGEHITHFDLMRVDPNERVTLHVPIVLKGIAPGTMSGGVLEQPLHSITLDCLAYLIPDTITVRIGGLNVGQAIHVKDLELPESAHSQTPADAIVVHVVEVKTKEALPGEPGAAEPEVIGKKPADAAAGDDKKEAPKKK